MKERALTDSGRLILVSNRLPVTLRRNKNGDLEIHPSSGGLVSGLSGLLRSRPFLWYGWPGLAIAADEQISLEETLQQQYSAVPIWLEEVLADLHYNGFSNTVLWPLLHHRTPCSIDLKAWTAYVRVNQIFATIIASQLQVGDIVWIHDYHLFLLPGILRQELTRRSKAASSIRIGFFLHTPFPPSNVFYSLDNHDRIMNSLCECDVIGFQTRENADNFLDCCQQIGSNTRSADAILVNNKQVKVGVFPIGIDSDRISQELTSPKVIERVAGIERILDGRKLICGVDRLDFIKGIPQKLRAFEMFLETNSSWLGKVSFIQVVVPSRESVVENKELRDEIDRIAARVNERFAQDEYRPIVMVHRHVSFEELIALYAGSHACVVSSVRDGMNLVSHEYIASQEEGKGVLLLSKYAGAAQIVPDCLLIDPHDVTSFSCAYDRALSMDTVERELRWKKSFEQVQAHNSASWGWSVITALLQDCQVSVRRKSEAGMAGQEMSQYYAS